MCLAALPLLSLLPIPEFWITLGNYAGINALVALGLVMLTGVAGLTSFGQAAFVGIGAYSAAAVSVYWGGSPWLGLLAAIAVSATAAAALGALTMKLSGHFLPIGTLAWGVALYYLFGNQEALGKFDGLSGLPPLSIFGVSLASNRYSFIFVWAVVLAAVLVLRNLLNSRVGRALHALHSAPIVAEACGVSTPLLKLRCFVLAAVLAAIAGWLYAHTQRAVNPTPFGLSAGITYLFMTVIGGAAWLGGAVLGATVVTVGVEVLKDILPRLLGHSGSYETIALGLVTILLLQRAPDGLWPTLREIMGRFWGAHYDEPPPHAQPEDEPPPPVTGPERHCGPLLEVARLRKAFGGLVAVDGATLILNAGEIVGLIGPNGAGKSTFFNLLSGVLAPDCGSVRFMQRELSGKPPRHYAALGMARTFQHVRLLSEFSCLENAAMGAYLLGRRGWLAAMVGANDHDETQIKAEARRQLERVGLASLADAPAGSLALGQQRILEIARALASRPVALLLDEPAAGLRYGEKRALAELLSQLREDGMAILIVEHDMEFLMPIANRLVVLQFGKVIAEGPPETVRNHPAVIEAYLGADV
jgi:branched-chain amino acid transport system permease protein